MSLTLLNYTSHGVRTDAFLTVQLSESLVSLEQGETADITATVTRSRVGIGTPTLSFTNLPSGLTAAVIDTSSDAALVMTYTIRFTASGSATPTNLANVRVTATTPIGTVGVGFVTVTVTESPGVPGASFVLSTSTAGANVAQGGTMTVNLNLVRAPGYTTTVTPSLVESLPSGVTVDYVPSTFSNGTTTVVATFTATEAAALGAVDLTFRGSGAGAIDSDTPFRLRVIGTEQYAHFESPFDPPTDEDGDPLPFNPTTGLYEGTVFDTAWLTRQWLIDNADTVVTIKSSGGTYGPLQLETAFSDAVTRGDCTVIVVDTGLVVDRPPTQLAELRLLNKNVSYEAANWVVTVPSDFWDATWTPTPGQRVDIRPAANGGLEEQQHMFYVQNGPQINGETPSNASAGVLAREDGSAHKYAFIGAYFRPTPTRTIFKANASVLGLGGASNLSTAMQGFIAKWCVIDGDWRHDPVTGIGKRFSRCALVSGRRVAFEDSILMRQGQSGGEANCYTQVRGRRVKLKNCMIEGQAINVLFGGSDPGSEDERLQDIEVQRNYMCKSDVFNRASSRYGLNTWTGWQETNSAVPPGINTYSSVKACFQIKFAQRALVQANIIENTFPNAVNGVGILLEVSGQGGSVINGRSDNHIALHNLVVRSNVPFSVLPHYNANLGIPPLFNVSVTNNAFMRSVYAHRLRQQENYWLPGWTSVPDLDATYPDVSQLLYGPYEMRHNTFFIPPADGEGNLNGCEQMRMASMEASGKVSIRYQFDMTDNILPNRWVTTNVATSRGIRQGGNPTNPVTDFELLEACAVAPGAVKMARNAIPLGITAMTRANAETRFPDQYEPAALWQEMGDNPWGWKAVNADPWLCDLELDDESPLKGLGEDGRDPGVDWPLLLSIVDGVRPYDPADLGVGITVDFS
jgi:hypothetical protein